MIFLTIGTHEPFDRLVEAIDEWCAGGNRDVFGQITDKGSYQPRHFEWVASIDPDGYAARCKQAEFLIAHAGMGSIITALTLSKPIVVLPRRGHLGETRNDHQFATAMKLRNRQGIFVAETETDLPGVLENLMNTENATAPPAVSPFADKSLTDALRRMIG